MRTLDDAMNEQVRNRSETTVDAELIAAIRSLAKAEGRDVTSLIDEALADFLEKHKIDQIRDHVIAAYSKGRENFGEVYKKLAE